MTEHGARRYLVTGALGCIGAWAVKRLLDEGATVVTFDKGGDPRRLRLIMEPDDLARLTMVEGDVSDLHLIERTLDAHEITNVIHLAALQVPFVRADPPLGALVNVVGTVNVFEAVKARSERMGPLVYAGSIGMFDAADSNDGRLHEDADAHPPNHYGVFKLANEGNARVYWQDDGVRSVAIRPMVVYGPGRDQGLTSDPTKAILAAVAGRPFEIGFGGRVLFQYAPDAAAAFIAASRSELDGARTYNLDGTLASIDRFIAALDAAVPGAAELITHSASSLPFPEAIDADSLRELGNVPVTPLGDAVEASVRLFRARLEEGRLALADYGLG